VSEDALDRGDAGGKAIRGGAAVAASYLGGLLISLASVPFMIRQLGEVQYGYFVTASAFVLIIGGVTEAGLTNLGIREYAVRSPEERARFLQNLVGLRLVLTTGGVLAAVAVAAVTGANTLIVQGTAITGLGLLVLMTQQTYMVPLNAQLRLGLVAALGLVRQTVLSVLVAALAIGGAGLLPFFWANVVMGVLLVGLTVALVRGTAPLRPAFDRAEWRAILRETLPYAVATAVGLVYFRIGVVLMSYVSTDAETGYFGAAFRVIEVLGALPWLLVSAAFPILARAATTDDARFDDGLQKVFEVATLVGAVLALGLGIGAPFAIDVLAGDDFRASVDVLRIQSVGLVTAFLMVTWTFALLSLKLFRELLVANAIAAAVAIVGTVALAPGMGAQGAALATVLAEAALAVACLVLLRRARPGLALHYGVVPKAALAALPGIALALAVDLHPILLAALAGLLFLGSAVLLRAIPPEVPAALRELRGRR
jgi:O-antigen/teichoic acid export membrane protein